MIQISKPGRRLVLVGLSVVVASTSIAAPASATTVASSPFCTNLSTSIAKVTSRLTTLRDKALATADARDQSIAGRRTGWDQQITDARARWDGKRTDSFEAMLSKAKDSAQRGYIQEYQRTITAAVETRHTTNDNARTTYRDAVDKALADSRQNLITDVDAYSEQISTARATAEGRCAATPAQGAAIRKATMTKLSEARQLYRRDRQDRVPTTFALTEILQTRNDAIAAGDAAYHKTAESARDTLREAMHDDTL